MLKSHRPLFHSVINFNVRFGMTNAAARVALAGDPLLAIWNPL